MHILNGGLGSGPLQPAAVGRLVNCIVHTLACIFVILGALLVCSAQVKKSLIMPAHFALWCIALPIVGGEAYPRAACVASGEKTVLSMSRLDYPGVPVVVAFATVLSINLQEVLVA